MEQYHKIFNSGVFQLSVSPGLLMISLAVYRFFSKIHQDIRKSRWSISRRCRSVVNFELRVASRIIKKNPDGAIGSPQEMIQEKTGSQKPLDTVPLKEEALYNQLAKKCRKKYFCFCLYSHWYECLCQVCSTFGKNKYSCPLYNKAPVTLEKLKFLRGGAWFFLSEQHVLSKQCSWPDCHWPMGGLIKKGDSIVVDTSMALGKQTPSFLC